MIEPMPEGWQRGMAVVAHPDDLEYGAASAVARWSGQGKEIAYVFQTLSAGTFIPWKDEDRALAAKVSDYWVNFAKTGDPNGPGLPAWAAFDAARPVHMVFDDAPSARPLAGQDRLAFWETQAKQ